MEIIRKNNIYTHIQEFLGFLGIIRPKYVTYDPVCVRLIYHLLVEVGLKELKLLTSVLYCSLDYPPPIAYRKAVDKFESQRAQYNIAVTYINMNELAKAKNALSKVTEDADVYNALGVIALREGDLNAAAEYFAVANNEAGVENAAIIDILDGEYEAAAQKLAGKKSFNAALAQLLIGNVTPAATLEKDCAKSAYLRAVAAARQGNTAKVKAELEKASKNEKLAQRAAKDVEFAKVR